MSFLCFFRSSAAYKKKFRATWSPILNFIKNNHEHYIQTIRLKHNLKQKDGIWKHWNRIWLKQVEIKIINNISNNIIPW